MWDLLILKPMVNALLWLYGLMGNSYVLAILGLTVIINLIVFPLRWQQQKSTAGMQELQPKLKKLQEKYKSAPEELQRKTMELYREAGINPLGGCLPMLIQFPILIGLYQAITRSLAASPLKLIELSQYIYHPVPDWLRWLPNATSLIPLNSRFFWLNLASPDPYYILPLLVVLTTWIQNKLMTPPSTDPQQATMGRTMQWTMPLFIGYISLTFPSGLSIYWIVANIIGVVQYAAMGKSSLKNFFGTEDGSFSWRGLIGLPIPDETSKAKAKATRVTSNRPKSGKN
ncbi:MAG: membrane protein insertase YidC [Anaerolineae bacterium]|nr:membrane protein insertase YidC [Anaerolineae bacterium]